jgi:AcrR family transcriptional regulator
MSGEARREQVLDVTKAIVAARGFHAVSIEGVAREAGISRPIVYGHFDDLAGLLDALVRREGARALAQLAAVLPPPGAEADPAERLLTGLRGYLEVVRRDPATWRLVLVPPEGAPPILHEAISRGRRAVVGRLAAALGDGALDAPDPELAAHLVSAWSDEAARLMLSDPERYPPERVVALARWWFGRPAVPPV